MSTNQNTQLATKPAASKPSALAVMASRLNVEPAKLFETLKSTVFQKASDNELLALVVVSNEYGLNPFLKEIYAFPAKGGGIVPIVSVDGWNKMLIRHPDFDGIEFEMVDDQEGNPHSCTATVYVKGRARPVKITEYFNECFRKTEPWENMPRRMLRNRTLCQASRVAFGFAGVFNEDEAANIIDVQTLPPTRVLVENASAHDKPTPPPDPEPTETPQAQLQDALSSAELTFEDFVMWANATKGLKDADSLAGFSDIPTNEAKRLVRVAKDICLKIKTLKG